MNDADKSQFNAIVILDAVPDGEPNTARRLNNELEDIAFYIAEGLHVRYVRISTINDLELGIAQILDEIKNNALKPWLHLDGHGLSDESGFVLADGTPCSWVKFKEIITPINLSLHLNLMVVLATCFGGSFARAIDAVDRAPVLGLIGPTRKITVGEVDSAFPAFYRTFFESASLSAALKVLYTDTTENSYYGTTAEQFFYSVWASYKKTFFTEEEIENRARRMHREAIKQKLPHIPSVELLKLELKNKDKERDLFEKYRDFYFMYDIEGFNRKRFPVTYESAEAQAK